MKPTVTLRCGDRAHSARYVYYDALNRLTAIDHPGAAEDIAHTYDTCLNGIGRLCRVTDAGGVTEYDYDAFGQITGQRRTVLNVLYTTRYTHDAMGRVSGITYPDGRLVSYTRDAAGRLSGVSATVNGVATALVSSIARRADGKITGMTRGNGLIETRDHDLDGRLLGQTVGGHARVYSYDAAGNVTLAQSPTQLATYTYDALDRLTRDYTSSAQTYTYDANGNRLKKGGTSYLYNTASNRLKKVGSTTHTLDAAGNTLTQGAWTYSYNNAGQLSQARSGTTLKGTYTYDAQGRRAYKKAGSVTTVYHYDLQGRLLAETKRTGALIRAYVYLDDLPVAQIDRATGDSVLHLHGDHLDTARLATNAAGTIVWRWEGRAFGDTFPATDPDGDGKKVTVNLRFAGQYYDGETGLHYNWHRYYDPRTGRYITSDPIGLEGGLNAYTYVNGNPINFTDPLGLMGFGGMPPGVQGGPGQNTTPSSPGSVSQVGGAVGDFWDNYQDMRQAGWKGADKYFHCKANCEASQRGSAGEATACKISDTREWWDQNVKGYPASDSAADQIANRHGRGQGSMNPGGSCSAACAPFRPVGLPPQY